MMMYFTEMKYHINIHTHRDTTTHQHRSQPLVVTVAAAVAKNGPYTKNEKVNNKFFEFHHRTVPCTRNNYYVGVYVNVT